MPVLVPQGVPSFALPMGMHTRAPVPHWITPAAQVPGMHGMPFWQAKQVPLPLQTPWPPSDAAVQLTPGEALLHAVVLIAGWHDWQSFAGLFALAA
jgi:hypothetical protein